MGERRKKFGQINDQLILPARRSGKTLAIEETVAEALAQGEHVVNMAGRRGRKTAQIEASFAEGWNPDAIDIDEFVRAERSADFRDLRDLYEAKFTPSPEPELPKRLSIDIRSPDYHPSFVRVGVRVDGKERNDIQWYDLDRKEYMTTDKTSHMAESIEPYWRFAESRQQRRARERWEGKHK